MARARIVALAVLFPLNEPMHGTRVWCKSARHGAALEYGVGIVHPLGPAGGAMAFPAAASALRKQAS